MNRTRAKQEQHQSCNHCREIGVHNRRKCAIKAGFHCLNNGITFAAVFPNAFIYKNVGIDGHADNQHQTRDTRQRNRCTDQRYDRDQDNHVDGERHHGDDAKYAVGKHHEKTDEQGGQQCCGNSSTCIVVTQRRSNCAFFQNRNCLWQRTGPQNN